MKFIDARPFADLEAVARKLMEIASGIESVQDDRIFIELINGPLLFEHRGSPAEYGLVTSMTYELARFPSP